jgi:hypothetical protein
MGAEESRSRSRTFASSRATCRPPRGYEADGRTWRHPFGARLLDDKELDGELAKAGLRRSRILDERGAWVESYLLHEIT